jgi:hypothetical protein
VTGAPHAGDDDNRAVTTIVSGMQKANERCSTGLQRVTVQIEFPADLELSAPNALLSTAILRRPRHALCGRWWLWRLRKRRRFAALGRR